MLNNNGLFSLAYAMLKPSWNSSLHFHLLSWLNTIIVFSQITFYSPLIIFFTTPLIPLYFNYLSICFIISNIEGTPLFHFFCTIPPTSCRFVVVMSIVLQIPWNIFMFIFMFPMYMLSSCFSNYFSFFTSKNLTNPYLSPHEFLLLATKISHTLSQG